MEKQTKISYLLFMASVLFVILHNAIYALFKFEELIFFILAFLSILGFIASIFYNIITFIEKGKPKDLWKLGWLGLFGLVGFIPKFGPEFYGLFAFFAFFGTKGKNKTRK